MSEALVNEFVTSYQREVDYYQAISKFCGDLIEEILSERGIRAIVTYRAKRPNKLLSKLLQRLREQDKKYQTLDDVRNDTPDLAGVRLALYFPANGSDVDELLRETFDVHEKKIFPQDQKQQIAKRFSGYHAQHYRVSFKEESLADAQKHYGSAKIEIQVGSVLMHAWAEVEHDLIYKPESGALSDDEHAILDELNGMVIAGEIALERLQRAGERRLTEQNASFNSAFDLAAFLHRRWHPMDGNAVVRLGRLDVLWDLLKKAGKNTPRSFEEIINPSADFKSDEAISDQIIDLLLAENPELYTQYYAIQLSTALDESDHLQQPTPEVTKDYVTRFLEAWQILERTMTLLEKKQRDNALSFIRNKGLDPTARDLLQIAKSYSFDDEAVSTILAAKRIRGHIVHSKVKPGREAIERSISRMADLFHKLEYNDKPTIREAFAQASQPAVPADAPIQESPKIS